MRLAFAVTTIIAGFSVQPALAGGLTVTGGASLSYATSGTPGTRADAYGYVEGSLANVYAGASLDVYKDSASDEVDLDIGYRNTLGSGLSYDLSYTRYIYPSDGGDCCGDVALSLSLPVGDALTMTLDGNYYTEDKTTDTHLTVDFAVSDKITLTGVVGRVGNAGDADTKEWELAATYALGEETGIKVHYYDGNDYKPYIGVDLTWDTTLLGG